MRVWTVLGAIVLLVLPSVAAVPTSAAETPCHVTRADWTVLVYLNADNNLEKDAFINFAQMARVGSSKHLNVVVQFDRNGKYYPTTPTWPRTLRFCVEKGMVPSPSTAVMDMGRSLDMGDGATLAEFVRWGTVTYPAQQTALIIWDHGQGWRGVEPHSRSTHNFPSSFRSASGAPFKSVSYDETSNDELYNRKIQDALTAQLNGKKLSLIGFDACLMQMIETAYAMRSLADVQVGSEDLEPGRGWPYDLWLSRFEAALDRSGDQMIDAATLGTLMVSAYRDTYGQGTLKNDTTTLSALRLDQIVGLATATSTFADDLRAALPAQRSVITSARDTTSVFAPNPYDEMPPRDYFFGVDLDRFASQIQSSAGGKLADDAAILRASIAQTVVANYAGRSRAAGTYGGSGIAIYFPPSADAYANDAFALHGYDVANTSWPVEFVQKERWAAFLTAYWASGSTT